MTDLPSSALPMDGSAGSEGALPAFKAGSRRGALRRSWRETRRHLGLYSLGVVLPLAVYALFVGYPITYTIYLSFCKWDGISRLTTFVAFANYTELFYDNDFWTALWNTLKWTLGTLIFSNILAFVLAVILRSRMIYCGTFLRLLFFLPVTMSLVAIGLMFSFILTPAFGGLDLVAQVLGFPSGPDLVGNPKLALYTLILVFGWSYLGIPLILFDAGLTQVPEELYEAAELEGANGFHKMWIVTIPMLRPIFVVVTILAVLEALRAFDLTLVMTRGGPGHATDTLGYFMWVQSFLERRFGYGAAVSVVMLVLSSVFAIIYIKRAGHDALGGER